ncbi:MAG: DUF4390 domain-containing protein [Thiohalobacterales bacterium]|nr:DUF4390 domain-containing protein [Thiohalobacterales bacterium]
MRALDIRPGHQSIQARLGQELILSREAIEAIQHGVPLTLTLELELRDARDLTLLADDQRHFVIHYLPLSEHFQLSGLPDEAVESFPRLRHVLAALSGLDLDFQTGPLAPGSYELRARMRLDSRRLPAPMRLPALLSAGWRHQSEWTTWPFVINA